MAGRQTAPCKFWAQGNCLKGANCNFKHVGFQQQQGNKFAVFGQQQQQQQSGVKQPPAPLTKQQLTQLVVDDMQRPPIWGAWSSYGCDKYAATALEGDLQPEELRLQAYAAARQGPQALQLYRQQVATDQQQRFSIRQEAACHPEQILARSSVPSALGGGGLLSTPVSSVFAAPAAAAAPVSSGIFGAPVSSGFGLPAAGVTPSGPTPGPFAQSASPFAAFATPAVAAALPTTAVSPLGQAMPAAAPAAFPAVVLAAPVVATAAVPTGVPSGSSGGDMLEYSKPRFTFRKIPEQPPP
eukprot:TRINITY_DN24400_c0_g1_i1.p1 TRINITY_DN24400_c0_g1~~TRINITY_DN24400_c0_g1_i1.p1  ORF type:complete len:297 (-),score=63.49 TRINITY_DN24400_c0_g1_i1:105-995(-)